MLYKKDDLTTKAKDLVETFHKNVACDQKIIDGVVLLLMVVNDNEYTAAMCYFNKEEAMLLESEGRLYYVGKWGKIPAALVQQQQQGITGVNGSQEVTRSSIPLFTNLKVIIALGVCGTMGRLGDVIVSSHIDECKYKAKGDQLISRANNYEPGEKIYGFLKDSHTLWSFPCTKQDTEDYKAVAVLKPMLSGTPLVASGKYRDKLKAFLSPEAGGVEMEGIGVIDGIKIAKKDAEKNGQIAEKNGQIPEKNGQIAKKIGQIEFIIVKAGCDYADESKNKEWQPVAAMAAADFVHKQLDREVVLNWLLGKFTRKHRLHFESS